MKWLWILALVSMVCPALGVTVSGSTTVLPIAEFWAESVTGVMVSGGGTGAGIQSLAAGRCDVAMTSRQMTPEERAKMPGNVTETLIGYDGLCFVSHKSGVYEISQEQLQGIYNGNITNWKELGGNDQEILPIVREGGSGTQDMFLKDVMGDKKAECPGALIQAYSSAEVKLIVKATPGAIGFVGYSFINGVSNMAYNGVFPTEETIKDKKYSISRSMYFYTLENASNETKAFVQYAISPEGQKLEMKAGFIPA